MHDPKTIEIPKGVWQIHVIGGGTVFDIRPHLALCAPVFDASAVDKLATALTKHSDATIFLHTTKMAGNREELRISRPGHSYEFHSLKGRGLRTNSDVAALIDEIVADPESEILFLPVAMCDFNVDILAGVAPNVLAGPTKRRPTGRNQPRLSSKERVILELDQAEKVIQRVRKTRKDLFLVGFKSTTDATEDEQFEAGLTLLKQASCNLVFANDLSNQRCMIVTPEQAKYEVGQDRDTALTTLVQMALARADSQFTRSTVVEGEPVSWTDPQIPVSLRTVVDHCIKRGAYKPFLGSTVGHFATKIDNNMFLTSRRRTNFNEMEKVGLVRVETKGENEVIAYGSKPSVGGQSQRIIFAEHPDTDCIVHFHCPLRENAEDLIPTRPQWQNECGSMECGKNTSDGLEAFDRVKAVYLDRHGPNIVFHRSVDPKEVIDFIERNFDLTRQTSE